MDKANYSFLKKIFDLDQYKNVVICCLKETAKIKIFQ